jgi:UDP-N-acetylmuramyl pentapeptide phosphotransferase/UDP-N-acetylglucosamine-1-phosphate transferase
MKSTSVAGILLVVLGALILAYQGITYTRHQKILDIGPFHATQDTQEHVPLSPILGGLALVAGIALLLVGARAKA